MRELLDAGERASESRQEVRELLQGLVVVHHRVEDVGTYRAELGELVAGPLVGIGVSGWASDEGRELVRQREPLQDRDVRTARRHVDPPRLQPVRIIVRRVALQTICGVHGGKASITSSLPRRQNVKGRSDLELVSGALEAAGNRGRSAPQMTDWSKVLTAAWARKRPTQP